MATDAQIYHHAADALAQMKMPTFEGLDPAEVTRAFDAVFTATNFLDPDPRWLDDFAREVGVISAGRVTLRAATDDELPDFEPRLKGPAGYLVLTGTNDSTGTNEELRLVLVPSFPPFQTRG